MARPVAFDDVVSEVRRFGPLATLVTVTTAGTPHVGTVLVAVDGDRLRAGIGTRTRSNLLTNPSATLTFRHQDSDYQLILDGTASVGDPPGPDGLYPASIEVHEGILHRVAGRAEALPSCLPLGSAPSATSARLEPTAITEVAAPIRVVGTIRTAHRAGEDTPVQAALNPDEEAAIELDDRYADALEGLEGFSHVWLLTWLAPPGTQPPDSDLRQVPYLLGSKGRELGIFATRGPRRPNRIGLSLVRLIAIDGTTIRFAGVDLLDGTALLDLKPYVVRFDQPNHPVHSGWFDTITYRGTMTPAALRSPPQDERSTMGGPG